MGTCAAVSRLPAIPASLPYAADVLKQEILLPFSGEATPGYLVLV